MQNRDKIVFLVGLVVVNTGETLSAAGCLIFLSLPHYKFPVFVFQSFLSNDITQARPIKEIKVFFFFVKISISNGQAFCLQSI